MKPDSRVRFSRPRRVYTVIFLLIAALAAGSRASAIQAPLPETGSASYEVDLRGATTGLSVPAPASSPAASALSRSAAWRAFEEQNPGWTVDWNVSTGAPARLQGPPVQTEYGAVTRESAEAACRGYLAVRLGAWIPVHELVAVKTVEAGRGYWVHFAQRHEGVPVWGTRVTVRISADGTVQRLTNRTSRIAGAAPVPALSAAESIDRARAGLPGRPEPVGAPELMYLPISQGWATTHALVWRSTYRTQDPAGLWNCFVDAHDGRLLWRTNDIRYADVSGNVMGLVEPLTANEEFQASPLPYVSVAIVNADSTVVQGQADAEGNYAIATAGATGRVARAALAGPYGFVVDAVDGMVPTAQVAVPDGDPAMANILFDDLWAEAAERDVYYHAMVAHDFIKTIEPGYNLLDYPMPIVVNINQRCNAYWDGYGVNFFAAGGPCVNTARIADVVYHEYGHGITDLMYRPFACSPAMAEGFSDYYACTIMDSPLVGVGFYGEGSILRRIDEDRVYPDDWVDESHEDGLILASTLWDLREELGAATSDRLWHFARYGGSDNYDDYFMDVLAYDDDNNNIYDGTPNLTAIANAYRAHGIGDFGIRVAHVPHPDTEDLASPPTLRANFLSIYALLEESVVAHIEIVQGSESTTLDPVMEAADGVRAFETTIPAQPAGTTVRYYFTAADTSGTTVTYPPAGAAQPLEFRIGADTTPPTIAHAPLYDQPLVAPGYAVAAAITDNLDRGIATPSVLYRVNGGGPTSLPMVKGADARYAATLPAAAALGDLIEYAISATDSASVPNTTTDPAEGWHAFHVVRGYLEDLETDDGGCTASGGWEWGTPSDPVAPYSGEKVWGVSLHGAYDNNTTATLTLPPLDLTEYGAAALLFRHWLSCEPEYDGGIVEVSIDGGSNWSLLVPDGDYDMGVIALGGLPGFSGGAETWLPAQIDLRGYVGVSDLRIRFTFVSDVGVVGPGWFLDDISVVERQVIGTPIRLVARGTDGRVDLAWEAPAGSGGVGSGPVTGYHVYRATPPLEGWARVTEAPVVVTRYEDHSVTNGTEYLYEVSAMYGDEEGPPSNQAMAMPFRPEFEAGYASLDATILAATVLDTTIVIGNSGSGILQADVFEASPEQSIDDVRIEFLFDPPGAPAHRAASASGRRVPSSTKSIEPAACADALRGMTKRDLSAATAIGGGGPRSLRAIEGDYDTLAVDSDDPSDAPVDFAALLARQTADSLDLRIVLHEPCGNPMTDFHLAVPFNMDDDITYGLFGGEVVLLAGPIIAQYFGVPAVLMTGEQVPIDVPSWSGLEPGSTQIDFGMTKGALGYPTRATGVVSAFSADMAVRYDALPDQPSIPWLEMHDRHVSVEAGAPQPFGFQLVADSSMVGAYAAKMIFETTDPSRHVVEVPVNLVVEPVTPVALGSLSALAGADGVELSWEVPSLTEDLGFLIYRMDLANDVEVRLFEEPLRAGRDLRMTYVDRSAPRGTEIRYRLDAIGPQGDVLARRLVTVSTRWTGTPLGVWLGGGTPNPAAGSVAVRYGLPAAALVRIAVFDPAGRLIRTLEGGAVRAAGYHAATWDGRDDSGNRVAAGVYVVRLESMGKTITSKLMRLR